MDMLDRPRVPTAVLLRAIVKLAITFILLGVLLFIPAGDILWAKGWLFLLVFFALIAPAAAYLWRTNPDIYVARGKIHKGTKGWDRVLMALLFPSLLAILPLAALDDGRFHWSSVPPWLVAVGYLLFCVGFALTTWAQRVNKFAEPGVRIQTERGHKAIDKGPYAIVRHPMYLAALWLFSGLPLALGSFWALIATAVSTLILVVRTAMEDKTLQAELQGYKAYAARVRYRLVPRIW